MSTLTTEKSCATRAQTIAPRVNLHQDGEGYTLEVEMPGVDKEGVDITVENGQLTLVGRRKSAAAPGQFVYRERSGADYRRAFDLDPSIDSTTVSAHIEQGLLTVRLQKAEALKPRRIVVS